MGLIEDLKGYFLRKKIEKLKKTSPVERNVDILLADEMKTMTATNRTIEKLLKVKIMRQETQHTLNKINDLDAERDYGEEEEESQEDFEEGMKKMLMEKILGGIAPQPNDPQGEFGVPVEEQPQQENPILDAVNNMTPEQMQKLKGKFLG